jgi:hypothetical protein
MSDSFLLYSVEAGQLNLFDLSLDGAAWFLRGSDVRMPEGIRQPGEIVPPVSDEHYN